jgi:hypothetical protein
MEKDSPPGIGHAAAYHSSRSTNPSSTDFSSADGNVSAISYYPGLEVVPDDAVADRNLEAPPAYHQLTIGDGDISAEVMRMYVNLSVQHVLMF